MKMLDIQFLCFCKKMAKSLHKKAKICENSKIVFFLIVPPIIFELQRRTIPHFKALYLLFWLLALFLTLCMLRKLKFFRNCMFNRGLNNSSLTCSQLNFYLDSVKTCSKNIVMTFSKRKYFLMEFPWFYSTIVRSDPTLVS